MRSPPRRVRRSPEEARRQILDAALRLFADHGPDAVGLKDVAREARVSHALVTHYFGTYDALVESAFRVWSERARADTIARIAEIASGGPRAWVEHAGRQLEHPVYGRLAAWAMLSGRAFADDFFMRKEQGFKKVADAIEMRLAFEGKKDVSRDEIELSMVLTLSALMGYTLARHSLWAGLGRTATAERDGAFRELLGDVIESHVTLRRERAAREKKPRAKRR